MDPVSASLIMMVICVPLMFLVIGFFVLITKLLTKMFPAE
jgi:hypothetical protein